MKKLGLSLMLGLMFMPLSSTANPGHELMDKLQNIKTFDAQFKQTIKEQKGQPISESTGVLKILRPGKFYWKSEQPDQVLVVADGEFIWTYDMELEQIVKNKQATTLGSSPASLLAGKVVDIEKDYDVKTVAAKACSTKVDACYQLHPKDKEAMFKKVNIGFQGPELSMIMIDDALDQNVLTTFTKVKINGEVNQSLFKFTPPPGVDVISGNAA